MGRGTSLEDASVPVEHLADYIAALDRLMTETDTRAVYYAHASAGCLHVRPFLNTKDTREVAKMRAISEAPMTNSSQLTHLENLLASSR